MLHLLVDTFMAMVISFIKKFAFSYVFRVAE